MGDAETDFDIGDPICMGMSEYEIQQRAMGPGG